MHTFVCLTLISSHVDDVMCRPTINSEFQHILSACNDDGDLAQMRRKPNVPVGTHTNPGTKSRIMSSQVAIVNFAYPRRGRANLVSERRHIIHTSLLFL